MGKQSSKIKDIIFVTGTDLDPEELKINRKNNPTQKPGIDLKQYKPRPFSKDSTDDQIEKHMQKVEKKQKLLKYFKHYQDFDRINFKQMGLNAATFEIFSEEMLKLWLITSIFVSRIIQVQIFNEYMSVAGVYRMIIPSMLIILPIYLKRTAFSPEYHVINHEYFRLVDQQTALYQQYHLNFDLYRDVNRLKYDFKYPSVAQFYKTKRSVFDKHQQSFKGLYKEYFQYHNQLKLDHYEEFVNKRKSQRKNSKQALVPQQIKTITKDIQEKHSSKPIV